MEVTQHVPQERVPSPVVQQIGSVLVPEIMKGVEAGVQYVHQERVQYLRRGADPE